MIIETLKELFNRDLNKLKNELNLYKSESNLWIVHKDITNSPGNLCLHIIGNLNAFIGAELGNTGYIRQRNLEFSLKNVPRKDMINQIDDLLVIIENTLSTLTPEDLQKGFPLKVFKDKMTTEFFLVHLATHLSYHLGQINYHRRLLDTTL
jgi:hypothetical protein